MEIRAVSCDAETLASYESLFRSCFPNASHLNVAYLEWLYAGNPAGHVIGCDAWEGDTLAAHYACVPVDAKIGGRPARVMLSLNTATHPDFQGKGLFTRLADATYEAGATAGLAAVYGVANTNSTPGFLRKLGFGLVRPLDARIGIGRIDIADPATLRADSSFHRDWSPLSLRWRIANPARPYRLVRLSGGGVGAEAPTGHKGLSAWDELPLTAAAGEALGSASMTARLHLGLRPGHRYHGLRWFEIPRWYRPSPLNMIFRSLDVQTAMPDSDGVVLGQLDFDAF